MPLLLSRATTRARRSRLSIDQAIQIAANVAVVAGIVIAIVTIYVQRETDRELQRRQAAMDFVMLQYQPQFLEAATAIESAFQDKDLVEELLRGDDPTREAAGVRLIERAGRKNFGVTADYYQSAIECVHNAICDEQVIRSALGPSIRNTYCWTRDNALLQIEQDRRDPGYRKRIAAFVNAAC